METLFAVVTWEAQTMSCSDTVGTVAQVVGTPPGGRADEAETWDDAVAHPATMTVRHTLTATAVALARGPPRLEKTPRIAIPEERVPKSWFRTSRVGGADKHTCPIHQARDQHRLRGAPVKHFHSSAPICTAFYSFLKTQR